MEDIGQDIRDTPHSVNSLCRLLCLGFRDEGLEFEGHRVWGLGLELIGFKTTMAISLA